jgi:hypothetical protein
MSKVPPIEQLARPEPLHKVLAEHDKIDDCTPCRITGGDFVLPGDVSLTFIQELPLSLVWVFIAMSLGTRN